MYLEAEESESTLEEDEISPKLPGKRLLLTWLLKRFESVTSGNSIHSVFVHLPILKCINFTGYIIAA